MRIAIASHAITWGLNFLNCPDATKLVAWSAGSFSIVAGTAILIGFLTPLAGAASTVGYLALSLSHWIVPDLARRGDSSTALYLAVISLSLILLGPGALSVDARLFGRREIILR